MPEGHTIFRLAADQNKSIARQVLHITSPQGRFCDGAAAIDGLRLTRVQSLGKHLFYHFAKGPILHVHLGLFGKYRTHSNPPPDPRGAVRVRFEGRRMTVDLNGPNRCELLDRKTYNAIQSRLGPDPLQEDADPDRAWQRIHKSRAPIGLLLMDQSVMSGIGNIYRSEILFLLKIHPRTPGAAINRRQFSRLWNLSRKLLSIGVKYNRIITVDLKKLKKSPLRVPRGQLFQIFKKSTCSDCGGPIERFAQASRKVFACPNCQFEIHPSLPADAVDDRVQTDDGD